MAREIKETPVLTGEDAKRFEQAIKENETKRVSRSEYIRAMDTYSQVMANSSLK